MSKHNSYHLQNGCWNCLNNLNGKHCNYDGTYHAINPEWNDNSWKKELDNRHSLQIDEFGICDYWKSKIERSFQ
jgi:hypothetical protein